MEVRKGKRLLLSSEEYTVRSS